MLVTAATCGAAIILDAAALRRSEPAWVSFVFPLAVIASTGVGIALATRRRGARGSWIPAGICVRCAV